MSEFGRMSVKFVRYILIWLSTAIRRSLQSLTCTLLVVFVVAARHIINLLPENGYRPSSPNE